MSLNMEQLDRDAWRVLYLGDEWEYDGTDRHGGIRLYREKDNREMIAEPHEVKHLPPKPKQPTQVVIWMAQNESLVSLFSPTYAYRDRYTPIKIPWPFTPEHQRWMDLFIPGIADTEGLAFKLWTLIAEGWLVTQRNDAFVFFHGNERPTASSTLTAAVEAAWKMRMDAEPGPVEEAR